MSHKVTTGNRNDEQFGKNSPPTKVLIKRGGKPPEGDNKHLEEKRIH